MIKASTLVDLENATQSRRVFWDPEVYQREQDAIFGRSWLFLTHESLIPNPGDFVTGLMAEDKVIIARQKDGTVKAFLNSCTHRGNQICQAESGNAKSFVCNYHGWVYGTDGALLDVPLQTSCYRDNIDKSKLASPQVRIESYGGFLFGCHDPDAPNLRDYLGEYAWYLDSFLIGAGGGMELLGPPLKSILSCNWKVPVENFIGDAYHVGWTHSAALQIIGGPLAMMSGNRADMPFDDLGMQFTTRHGHGLGLIDNAASAIHSKPAVLDAFLQATRGEVRRTLGPERERLYVGHWNSSIFPNCSFLYGTNTFKVWHPRGPGEIEVWTWTMVHKNMDMAAKRHLQREAIHTFGTAGTLESDDGENMSTCTHSNRGWATRKGRINSAMGLNREGPHPDYPGIAGASLVGETSYRGFYRFWAELMDASDWAAIRANDANWDKIWTNRTFWQQGAAAE